MRISVPLCLLLVLAFLSSTLLFAQNTTNNSKDPTWWDKYQYLKNNGPDPAPGTTTSSGGAGNVDVSNECGPQSETYITINPASPRVLAAGSNEIFRDPMRGYASTDGGANWVGVDLPLPPVQGANNAVFGSDPTLAFDSSGNLYYGYIVVHFTPGGSINGTGMAVARSSDGGKSYPFVNFFATEGGQNHFNDKPMITADSNVGSRFRDNVYIAWDAALGGSPGGGVRVASSSDHGATFTITRVDNANNGQGLSIGAVPFVGPDGTLYVAWNNFAANTISFNRSFDGGKTWDTERVISSKNLAFDIGIPAIFRRGALVYPACAADPAGRLYCSWMDLKADGTTDIFVSTSSNKGVTWSRPAIVTDNLPFLVDRFNHWLSVDPVKGTVNISFYDTRNDTTGGRFETDVYFTQSTDGGRTWRSPNTRVTTARSNEHDCNGLFPCNAINYGNQYGDYEGLVSFNGVSHAIWTDSRNNQVAASGCRRNLLMEEVFTGTVK